MPSEVYKKTFYSMQSITGPTYILVSLRFGKTPTNGPCITKKAGKDEELELTFNLEDYVREVLLGLEKANKENNTTIEIEEIQVATEQKFHEGQVALCSYKIVKNYIEEEVTKK